MSAKKRGHIHAETPFDPQTVAAITKEIPSLLAREGYFDALRKEPVKKVRSMTTEQTPAVERMEMFAHAPLMHEEHHFPAPDLTVEKIHTAVPRGNRLKLLYSVIAFALVIFSIWIFNVRSTMAELWSDTKNNHTILDQGAQDFNSVLETLKENDRIVREKLKDPEPQPLDPATAAQVEAALKEAVQPKPTP